MSVSVNPSIVGSRYKRIAENRPRHNQRSAIRTWPRRLPQHRTDLGEDGRVLAGMRPRAEAGFPNEDRHRFYHVQLQQGLSISSKYVDYVVF